MGWGNRSDCLNDIPVFSAPLQSLLGLLAMPLLWAFRQYAEQSDTANFILFALMLVMFWSLMVTAHIIRRALEISAPKAVALTILYVVLAIILNGLVMSGVA